MRDYLNKFDKIMCGENVVESFYSSYNNDKDFAEWVDQNIPDLQKCERQQQNNPWHKYNVLGHILHSVQHMNKLSFGMKNNIRRMLSYIMLFHDIGKPNKHIIRSKNGQMIDSFFNHNEESEKIARRDLPKLGFLDDEVKIMCKLIFKHDIFMFIKTYQSSNKYWRILDEKLVRKEIEDLNIVGDGKQLLKYLLLVGRADNLAQNEQMTGESLALLDKFELMLDSLIVEDV